MRKKILRMAAVVGLLAVVITSGLTLSSGPVEAKGKKLKCPFPPCLAPCVFGVEPTVLCFEPGSKPFETTFACCCCGSSGRTRYQPL